jgi:hypothetical protein
MNANRLTVCDLVTLAPRLGEPGHKGRVTRLLSSGWVMVQWLTGTAQERREHAANLLRLHDDFDHKTVPFGIEAPVGLY